MYKENLRKQVMKSRNKKKNEDSSLYNEKLCTQVKIFRAIQKKIDGENMKRKQREQKCTNRLSKKT